MQAMKPTNTLDPSPNTLLHSDPCRAELVRCICNPRSFVLIPPKFIITLYAGHETFSPKRHKLWTRAKQGRLIWILDFPTIVKIGPTVTHFFRGSPPLQLHTNILHFTNQPTKHNRLHPQRSSPLYYVTARTMYGATIVYHPRIEPPQDERQES